MDRIIEVKVNGNYLAKDNKNAGVRGEANTTILRITFDEGWNGYGKRIFFIDALGGKPVSVVFGPAHWENAAEDTNVYLVPIPKEPLEYTGTMTFTIEGTKDNKVQRSITDELEVKDSPDTNDAVNSVDPTPSEIQQIQEQIEALSGDIKNAYTARDEAKKSEENAKTSEKNAKASETNAKTSETNASAFASNAETHSQNAEDWAEKAQNAISKVSYIGDNGHWFAWDAEKNEFYDTGFKAQAGSTVYLGDNPPEDADVWIYPDGEADFDGGGVVVDSVLSASSENPVQNKAVAAELAKKANVKDVYTKAEVDTAIAEKDFVVTLDVVEENISLSKTYDEIVTAFTEGKNVYLKALVNDNIFSVPLVCVGANDNAIFAGFSDWGYYISLSLSSNNEIVRVNENRLIDPNTLSEEYYTKTQVDTAIQTAIGDVLGGAS